MMGSRSRRLQAVICCVAVISVLVVAAGAVAADDANETSIETDSEEATYLIEIDDDVRVVDADMTERDTVAVVLEADDSTDVAITDASVEIDGAVDINQRTTRLPEGQTEVEFRVANPSQPAITISTHDGMVGIGDQEFDRDRPSIAWETVQALLFVTAIGSVGATYRIVRKRREDESPDSERVL